MLNIITCDFETFWSSKEFTLTKMGPIEYIRDPRFVPQLLGVAINRGPAKIFSGEAEIRYALNKLELDKPDKIVVGHNLNGFDALILSEYFGVRPALMMDTMVMARWCGIARMQNESHAKLTDWLGNGHKRAGTVISDGKKWPDQFTKAEQEDFKRYCCEDVEQCRDNFYSMLQYFKGKPDQFTELLTFATMTAKMATEPKLVIDRGILEAYIDRLDAEAEASRKELSELFHFASTEDMLKAVRSSGKFCEMLRALGMEPPMKPSERKTATLKAKLEFERETAVMKGEDTTELGEQIADLVDHPVMSPALSKNDLEFTALRDHPDPRIALLVDTRLEHNSSIQRSRAVSLLKFADGVTPVPVMLNALKAHTGRYSAGVSEGKSDGLQFQNLSKRDASKLDLRRAIHVPEGYAFVACDSSQIEARILAYAANETELVEQFRQKRDPYSELAEKIFGVPWQDIKAGAKSGDKKMKLYRNVGKTSILSAGYGVGATKFSNTLLRSGSKLSEDLDRHFELAKEAHTIYRLAHPNIVAFWMQCQQVIEHMYSLRESVGMFSFGGPDGKLFKYGWVWMPSASGDLRVPSILLPNGYAIRYPGLAWQRNEKGKMEWTYEKPLGKNIVKSRIYGSQVVENICQSLAFFMLAWQGANMYRAGIPIVDNIHDSFGAVVPAADADATLAKMEHHMSCVPTWLPGFPVACEGEIGTDFTIA